MHSYYRPLLLISIWKLEGKYVVLLHDAVAPSLSGSVLKRISLNVSDVSLSV